MATYSYGYRRDHDHHTVIMIYAYNTDTEVARVLAFPARFHLNGYHVQPNYQSRGLAYALTYLGIQKLIGRSRSCRSVVVPDCNAAIIATLSRCGFEITDREAYEYKGRSEEKGKAISSNPVGSMDLCDQILRSKNIILMNENRRRSRFPCTIL